MAFFRREHHIDVRPPVMANPTLRYVTYAIVALLLSLVHILFLPLIAIEGVTPDLLLIWGVWVALQEGQVVGMIVGFASGLAFDAVALDVLGSNALAKVIAVFCAGYFYKEGMERQRSGSWLFVLIVFGCSVVHNLIYYFFYIRPTDIEFVPFALRYGLYATLYTAVFAIIPKLVISRKTDF